MALRIGIFNGSLGGRDGNTGHLLRELTSKLGEAELEWFDLRATAPAEVDPARIAACDGFVFATGTYWDSWGSPLQAFLEHFTPTEGKALWLGKPASVLVTMHSVGGKEVLSRLQGVLSTMGLLIPPFSGMAYSYANQLAVRQLGDAEESDFWQLSDLEVIAHNLREAMASRGQYRAWSVDRGDAGFVWADR